MVIGMRSLRPQDSLLNRASRLETLAAQAQEISGTLDREAGVQLSRLKECLDALRRIA